VLFPATTAIFAAVLALVYASMTVWVMASRTSNGTLQGDGGNEGLQNRIRAHGNFGEYVPLGHCHVAAARPCRLWYKRPCSAPRIVVIVSHRRGNVTGTGNIAPGVLALSRELKASGSRANSGPKLTRPWPPPT